MQKILLLIVVSLFISCSSDAPRKPAASGKAGEMLVVMNTTQWEASAGDLVREVFASYVPMLPQAEPHFNLFQISPDAFAKLFETHRNILFVEFDPSLEKGKIEARRDQWSYPQMVIRVIAPNEEVLERILESNSEAFINYYLQQERERMINAYNRMINHQARKTVNEKLKLDLAVPEGYFVAKEAVDFIWLRQTGTREDLDLGLLITVLPYTDPAKDFNHKVIWERRDSITKLHIPGTFENTWMTTYPDIPPVFKEINFNDQYAVEARGLWKIANDYMGGPFVNITFVDEKNSRLINLDGFVYAPKFDKRDYLRQVEALMYSVKVYSEEEEPEGDAGKDDLSGQVS
jgi:hypothetical protein